MLSRTALQRSAQCRPALIIRKANLRRLSLRSSKMGSLFKGQPHRPFAFEPDGQICCQFIRASCCTQTPGTYLILQETKCVPGASVATRGLSWVENPDHLLSEMEPWRHLRSCFICCFLRNRVVTGRWKCKSSASIRCLPGALTTCKPLSTCERL